MSEATDKAVTVLTGLIEKAAGGIDSAVAFSQAQIPEVVSQLLVWNSTISILWQVFALIIIMSSVILFFLSSKFKDSDSCVVVFFCGEIIFVGGVIVFFSNFDWLKIWLAPKLYLLEYAAALVK